jgi:hypothetical protein
MAQITESLARSILNGSGFTVNEVKQLAHAWLASHAAPSVPDNYIRFDFINADGREDSKVITHDEMRERYANHHKMAHANFAAGLSL